MCTRCSSVFHLINGWENSGWCFRCFHKTACSTRQSVIHDCHIYKQIWRLLVGEILTLEQEEGYNHDKFAVSLLKHAAVLGHVPQSFCGCFDTSSGMERPSLVKFPIKESVVKLLPSASSLRSSYYLTSSFIKRMRLTCDGKKPQ